MTFVIHKNIYAWWYCRAVEDAVAGQSDGNETVAIRYGRGTRVDTVRDEQEQKVEETFPRSNHVLNEHANRYPLYSYEHGQRETKGNHPGKFEHVIRYIPHVNRVFRIKPFSKIILIIYNTSDSIVRRKIKKYE